MALLQFPPVSMLTVLLHLFFWLIPSLTSSSCLPAVPRLPQWFSWVPLGSILNAWVVFHVLCPGRHLMDGERNDSCIGMSTTPSPPPQLQVPVFFYCCHCEVESVLCRNVTAQADDLGHWGLGSPVHEYLPERPSVRL